MTQKPKETWEHGRIYFMTKEEAAAVEFISKNSMEWFDRLPEGEQKERIREDGRT